MNANFISRLSPRDRRALMIGVLLAAPVVAYRAMVKPYVAALTETREAVARERSLLQRELTLVAHAPSVPRQILVASASTDVVNRRLFTGDDVIEATSALSSHVGNVMRSASVTIQHIESSDGESADTGAGTGSGIREIRLELRAEGTLAAVLRGLRGLESGSRLVRVTRVSVERSIATPAPGAPESLVIAATVRGYARLAP